MRLLTDRHDEIHLGKLTFWITIIIIIICPVIQAWTNIAYVEGIPVIIEGKIQLIEYKYDKFFNYYYTRIEFQTFGDDTHYHYFLRHVDNIEFGKVYRITYTRTTPLGHHIWLIGRILEVIELEN